MENKDTDRQKDGVRAVCVDEGVSNIKEQELYDQLKIVEMMLEKDRSVYWLAGYMITIPFICWVVWYVTRIGC